MPQPLRPSWLAQAENHLLRQRELDLETALASRESAAKSAQSSAWKSNRDALKRR